MTTCRECRTETANKWLCKDCQIVEHALTAFWAVVAAAHPEITTGDGDDSQLRECALEHVRHWVSDNTVEVDETPESSPTA